MIWSKRQRNGAFDCALMRGCVYLPTNTASEFDFWKMKCVGADYNSTVTLPVNFLL